MESRYPILLYLNEKYVFDLLAMMEGELSQIETVRTSDTRGEESGRVAGGEIGVRNVFAFLGVSLSGSSQRSDRSDVSEEITRERVHSPNSLFARLRERLWEEKHVQSVGDLKELKPGTFVEFNASLRKNPLIDALEGMRSILRTAIIFTEESGPQQAKKQKGIPPTRNPNRAALEQFNMLLDQLTGQGAIDILGKLNINPRSDAILTLDQAFLADPSMSDLLDADYTVLGKVTKVLLDNSEERINLLRKTSLGKVQGHLLEQMKASFGAVEAAGFALPEMITEIGAPSIQVLPIGIFS